MMSGRAKPLIDTPIGGLARRVLTHLLAPLAAACCACVSLMLAPGPVGVAGALLALLMAAVAVTDARSYTIPDVLTGAGFALGLLQVALAGGQPAVIAVALASAQGMLVAAAFWMLRAGYYWLRGRDGLGLGDVKLAGVAGAWLTPVALPLAIEIAALSALAVYGLRQYMLGRPLPGNRRLPFGAFFAPAIWLGWLFQTVTAGRL